MTNLFTSMPFSHLWSGISGLGTPPHSADFIGDASPPFTELTESGYGLVPTSWELARIRYYHSKIRMKDSNSVDLDLTYKGRRLICAGRLFRADSAFEWKGLHELFVLLFDNYLVITSAVGTGKNTTFQAYKPPIPLDLLNIEINNALSRKGSGKDAATFPQGSWGITPPPGDVRAMFPFTVHHEGPFGDRTRLYAENEDVLSMWKSKLDEAIYFRKRSSKVFEVGVLVREEYLTAGTSGIPHTHSPEDLRSPGRLTSASPFVTLDGRTLLAVGSEEGLWIGNPKDPQSFCLVFRFPIQQCAVLGEHGFILTLSNGGLFVFDLEETVPKSTGRETVFKPRVLKTQKGTHFFRVGKLNGQLCIVAATKHHSDTVFYVWGVDMEGSDRIPQDFVFIHRFFLPVECNEAVLLGTALCIPHTDGFSLVKLPEMLFGSVPWEGENNVLESKRIIKRCSSARAISVTRVEGGEAFFLCYDRFGLYVDLDGVPLPDRGIIEWEGQASRASVRFPHVLLFSSAFVEVRNITTGRLVQIIRTDAATGDHGSGVGHIRYLWDGRVEGDYDPEFGYVCGDGCAFGSDGSEFPTVIAVADLPVAGAVNERKAQEDPPPVTTQQCVFTLFSPGPPPYSPHVEEQTGLYNTNTILL